MSTPKRLLCSALAIPVLLCLSGCIIVTGSGSSWGWGSTVWTEIETEQYAIDTNGLEALEVRTHNGRIEFDAQSPDGGEATVTVTKKGGGPTSDSAKAALDAVDVFVEQAGAGAWRIGWRWKGAKRSSWRACVSFAISAPGKLNLDAETHNGRIGVVGVAGDVRVVTHNGRIAVSSEKGRLYAESHNGEISADYAGAELSILTHNGDVNADLRRCGAVSGELTTYNGSVEITVGEAMSTVIRCETHNGRIEFDVPFEATKWSRRHAEGRLGDGDGTLAVSTHNGSVAVKKPIG